VKQLLDGEGLRLCGHSLLGLIGFCKNRLLK
jgi:hypothetical protein